MRIPALSSVGLVLAAPLFAVNAPVGYETTVEERRAWLFQDFEPYLFEYTESKTSNAIVMVKGIQPEPDLFAVFFAAAGEFWSRGGRELFELFGQARNYFTIGHLYPQTAPTEPEILSTNFLAADPNHYVRTYIDRFRFSWNNTGTENHRLMTWTSAYLFAQGFPEQTPWYWNGTKLVEDFQASALGRLIEVGKRRYSNGGYSEMLSPNYEIFHFVPMLNLFQFSADPNASAVGEAFLLYHSANMALHSFEGHYLAPWSRQATQQNRDGGTSIGQGILWYYFGLPAIDRVYESNPRYTGYLAASTGVTYPPDWPHPYREWRMPEAVQNIATEKYPRPFTSFSNQPFWQHNPGRQTMRINYVDYEFAVGTGNARHDPSAFALDDSKFVIVYTSPEDQFNYIQAFHPYWRSDAWEVGNDERAWTGPTSPFMQLAHHEDTVIILFEIPPQDPYAEVGRWQAERDGTNEFTDENDPTTEQVGATRFPKEIDEWLQDGDWFFLREDDVFIGIKVLKPGAVVESVGLDEFHQIISEEAETGFVYEVGTTAEFGTFAAFQAQLKSNPLVVDWTNLEVTYTNSSGDELFIRYNSETNGLDSSVPEVSVNGEFYDWANWPALQSPWVTLENSVLTINGENETVVSDWSGEIPVITREFRIPAPRATMSETGVEITAPTIFGRPMQLTRSTDGVNFDEVVDTFIGDGKDFVETYPMIAERAFFRSEVIEE